MNNILRSRGTRLIYRISLVFLLLVSLAAITAPFITKYSYEVQDIKERLQTSSTNHPFGTDSLGRDLYSRIIYGARVSMTVGIVTALCSLLLGTVVGAISGYLGGWADTLLMRIVDVVTVIPSLLLAILIMVLLGHGLTGIILALSLVSWVTQARLVRAQVRQCKELLHVEAARAQGASHPRILVRHILPLIMGPGIVALTFQIPQNIMAESFLSFIGLGIQPPFSSWGTIASEGFRGMRSYPHLILFPGIILFFTMMAFQFLGDGIRDRLDPRSKTGLD